MYTARELATLALAYSEGTGISLGALGDVLFQDHPFFKRLLNGKDCTTKRAAKAARFFIDNWPQKVAWPEGVPPPSASSDMAAN